MSVSGSPKSVSDRDKRFFDPHTRGGILLEGGEVSVPRIHECGVTTLDPSWSFFDVCSPFWRAYYNLGAGAAVRTNGRLRLLRPGHVVIIPQEVRYDCIPGGDVRHFWIHFSMEVDDPPAEPLDLELSSLGRRIWNGLARDAGSSGKVKLKRLHSSCLAALIDVLGMVHESEVSSTSRPLRELFVWFDANMQASPSLDELAARAGMGRRSFIRWFRNQTGSTPILFLTRRRIREACRLLRFGSDSIEQIAEATGFASRHHFTRVFSSETGCGPAQFRKGCFQVPGGRSNRGSAKS